MSWFDDEKVITLGQKTRGFWLEDWEKQAIVDFQQQHPLEGYRRLTFTMLDADTMAVSPASVYHARALSHHKHKLYLDGPTKLSPEALNAIRKHPNVRLAKRFQRHPR